MIKKEVEMVKPFTERTPLLTNENANLAAIRREWRFPENETNESIIRKLKNIEEKKGLAGFSWFKLCSWTNWLDYLFWRNLLRCCLSEDYPTTIKIRAYPVREPLLANILSANMIFRHTFEFCIEVATWMTLIIFGGNLLHNGLSFEEALKRVLWFDGDEALFRTLLGEASKPLQLMSVTVYLGVPLVFSFFNWMVTLITLCVDLKLGEDQIKRSYSKKEIFKRFLSWICPFRLPSSVAQEMDFCFLKLMWRQLGNDKRISLFSKLDEYRSGGLPWERLRARWYIAELSRSASFVELDQKMQVATFNPMEDLGYMVMKAKAASIIFNVNDSAWGYYYRWYVLHDYSSVGGYCIAILKFIRTVFYHLLNIKLIIGLGFYLSCPHKDFDFAKGIPDGAELFNLECFLEDIRQLYQVPGRSIDGFVNDIAKFNLVALTCLDLSYKNLSLRHVLQILTKLKEQGVCLLRLNLKGNVINNVDGVEWDVAAFREIFSCLKVLDLSENAIGVSNSAAAEAQLASLIDYMPNLQYLNLAKNQLSEYCPDEGMQQFARNIKRLKHLRKLVLRRNFIGRCGAESMIELLNHVSDKSLEVLDLSNNHLGQTWNQGQMYAFLTQLQSFLTSGRELVSIDLRFNYLFGGVFLTYISEFSGIIGRLPTTLDLTFLPQVRPSEQKIVMIFNKAHRFNFTDISDIETYFNRLLSAQSQLTELNLSGVMFEASPEMLQMLAYYLGLFDLTGLDLSMNGIGYSNQSDFQVLKPAISRMKNLKSLNLAKNFLGHCYGACSLDGIMAVRDMLSELRESLQVLDLGHNAIGQQPAAIDYLSSGFIGLDRLERLSLNYNELVSSREFGRNLQQLTAVSYLNLGTNALGKNPGLFANMLENFSAVLKGSVVSLNLIQNVLGTEDAVTALANFLPKFRRLSCVNLCNNNMSDVAQTVANSMVDSLALMPSHPTVGLCGLSVADSHDRGKIAAASAQKFKDLCWENKCHEKNIPADISDKSCFGSGPVSTLFCNVNSYFPSDTSGIIPAGGSTTAVSTGSNLAPPFRKFFKDSRSFATFLRTCLSMMGLVVLLDAIQQFFFRAQTAAMNNYPAMFSRNRRSEASVNLSRLGTGGTKPAHPTP